jgi:hypothetical protein
MREVAVWPRRRAEALLGGRGGECTGGEAEGVVVDKAEGQGGLAAGQVGRVRAARNASARPGRRD